MTKVKAGVHTTHRWPVWLPDGKSFLYLATNHENPSANEHNGIYVATLDGSENRMLMSAESNPVVVPGYLLYVQIGVLMAQPFDARRAQLQGDPIAVAEGVNRNPGTWRGAFDASKDGILVFQPGADSRGSQLQWLSRDGKTPTNFGERDLLGEMRLSRDGRKLALMIGEPQPVLWVYDVARVVRTRLTFEGSADASPVWSPDGNRIAFSQKHSGQALDIYAKDASGSGKEELLFSDSVDKIVLDWSPDGRYLLFASTPSSQSWSIWLLPLFGDRKPQPFLQATGTGVSNLFGAVLSPDGKWVAYQSRESGRGEIYVTSFPQSSGKWQVSIAGGNQPRWRKDGKALMYLSPDRTIMEAPIIFQEGAVEVGAVQPYVRSSATSQRWGGSYDIAPDGRVLVNSLIGEGAHSITMVVNWTAGLKK